MFGVNRSSGMPSRAAYVDKERKGRHCSINPRVVGWSVEEVLRTIKAIKEVNKASEDEAKVSIPSVKHEEGSKNDDGEMVSVTSGPKKGCPVDNWFSKIPNIPLPI